MHGGGEAVSGVREEESVTSDDVIETTPTETGADTDGDPKESVRETVEREFNKLKEGQVDGDGSQGQEDNQATDPQADKGQVKKAEDFELDPELLPPERLNAHEKQLFSNLPKGLKRGLHRTIKNLEGLATREKQELRQVVQQNRALLEAIEPYAPEWGMQGVSVPQAITQLAAAHKQLTHQNPEVRAAAYLKLATDSGIDLVRLAQMATGQVPAPQVYQQPQQLPPQVSQLQEKVTSLESFIQQQQIAAAARPIIDELNAVKNEKDLSGRYRYPGLHEDSFVHSLKPLVSELVATVPGITYGEAMKRAYVAMGGEVIGTSNQPIQTRFPGQSNTQERAREAAVSVRGRSSPGVVGPSSAEPPPEALSDPRATVRWALEQLRRG